MDIKNNRSLNRKSTYISSLEYAFEQDKQKNKIIISEKPSEKPFEIHNIPTINVVTNNIGYYIKQLNYDDYLKHLGIIKRTIQINGNNRDIKYYPSPFKFTTYIESNLIGTDENRKNIYTYPFIRNKIYPINSINLNKIIIPNNFNISKTKILDLTNPNILIINSLQQLLTTNQLKINQSYSLLNNIITVVNITSTKINIINNYDSNIVYCYTIINQIIDNNVFKCQLKYDNPSTKHRVYYLKINEFDDSYDYQTNGDNSSCTFKLIPKSLKSNFLYANTKNIQKVFDKKNIKTKKITISLLDDSYNEIKINNLDYDIQTDSKCICCPFEECKNFSCCCNYILHPYNPMYQMFIYFSFTYKHLIANATEFI
jgi:hypothetical protein